MSQPHPHTDPASIPNIVATARAAFDSGRTKPRAWRERQLRAIVALLRENEHELQSALAADLGKPAAEAYITEIGFTITNTQHTLKHLRSWLKPKAVRASAMLLPARAWTMLEPLGTTLIIAPWNYPVQLTLEPLAGAIAAGNAAVVKPSEMAPATSAVLSRLIRAYLDPDALQVVEGGIPETTALLEERFDHIFYTGNGTVGRIVARAAAEHLTPTTLELGGKSPAYIDDTVNLPEVARRLAWGKLTNAGQTCVAPDYVLTQPHLVEPLVAELRTAIAEQLGSDPQSSDSYGRIVNTRQFDRLTGLLAEADLGQGHVEGVDAPTAASGPAGVARSAAATPETPAPNGRVAIGGGHDRDSLYVAPTVLVDVPRDAPVMQEEIFGPILPIVEVRDAADATAFIRSGDKPLALYIFTEDAAVRREFLRNTSSGGVGINVPVAQLSTPSLPFGGVGESGMGSYHGEQSVRTFSHQRSVLSKPLRPDTMAMIYPPITPRAMRLVKRFMG